MARQKSYNDIKRQVERLQNSRFAGRATDIGDRYLSNARRASYWESRYRENGTEGYFGGKYYGRDNDKKLSRSSYSGKSDTQFYADELRKSGRIPKNAYKQSQAIRKGGTSAAKDYLRKNKGSIGIKNPDSFWNHYIKGFSNENGKLYARVYAQGDDTDTTQDVLVDDIERGRANIYLDESFRNGYSHRMRFDITKSDLDDATKRLADAVQEKEEYQYAQKLRDNKANGTLSDYKGVERQRSSSSTASKGGSNG